MSEQRRRLNSLETFNGLLFQINETDLYGTGIPSHPGAFLRYTRPKQPMTRLLHAEL